MVFAGEGDDDRAADGGRERTEGGGAARGDAVEAVEVEDPVVAGLAVELGVGGGETVVVAGGGINGGAQEVGDGGGLVEVAVEDEDGVRAGGVERGVEPGEDAVELAVRGGAEETAEPAEEGLAVVAGLGTAGGKDSRMGPAREKWQCSPGGFRGRRG